MTGTQKNILIINGSIRGDHGNSGSLVRIAEVFLSGKQITATVLDLADPLPSVNEVFQQCVQADALLIVTGVYWNNYSSLLQRFIEVGTAFENSPAFFGKPVACAVSADSVGGADVAARLLSVFVQLGCWTPPCSTLILSRTGNEAIAAGGTAQDDPNEDIWRVEDLSIVLDNLIASASIPASTWKSWPHVSLPVEDGPWPAAGPLDLKSPKFL